MSPNTINAQGISKSQQKQPEKITVCLWFTILFLASETSAQSALRKAFRKDKRINKDSPSIMEEMKGAQYDYQQENDRQYDVNEGITLIVDEASTRSYQNASLKIDKIVKKWCDKKDVNSVAVKLMFPTMAYNSSSVNLFFLNCTPKCFAKKKKEAKWCGKIDETYTVAAELCLEELKISNSKGQKEKTYVTGNLTANIVKLSALASHYVYYYIDCMELRDWTIWGNKKEVTKLIDECLDNKYQKDYDMTQPPVKSEKKKTGLLDKVLNWRNFIIPLNIIKSLISIVIGLDYKETLYKRIIKRTIEVLNYSADKAYDTTEDSKEKARKVLFKIISQMGETGIPMDFYDYYKACGYWDYLGEPMKSFSKKWKVVHTLDVIKKAKFYKLYNSQINNSGIKEISNLCSEMGFCNEKNSSDYPQENKKILFTSLIGECKDYISGFGGMLLVNTDDYKEYMYALKGTDFDSVIKDWLLTNIVQGITGFSQQHLIAIQKARILDKEVPGNLWFVGHSLGGGLASASTITTRARKGVSFNAAGLNFIGVKLNQLYSHPGTLFTPYKDWNRMFPYRLRNELLDFSQNLIGKILLLERGYGRKAVEILSKVSIPERHGINNFLLKKCIDDLRPYDEYEPNTGFIRRLSDFIRGGIKLRVLGSPEGIEAIAKTH